MSWRSGYSAGGKIWPKNKQGRYNIQSYGVDYGETFLSVEYIRDIRILFGIAAFYDYEIWQMDVKTAFLNGHLSEDVYMVQPEGFVDPKYPNKQNPGEIHWTDIKVILKYLRNTKDMVLVYGVKPKAELKKSAKQSTIAMSSTEAKYIAAAEASIEAVWMRKFNDGLGDVVPSNKRPMEMLKSKKHTHKPKFDDSIQEKLYLLHIDMCGLMRIESINGKKYILVIVDDYSRFTWAKFLRSKDKTLKIVIKLLKKVQVRLNATVRNIRTDNGTKFMNQTLQAYYERQKLDLTYFHVFGVLCYPTNDGEDPGKLKPKADIGIFVGYAPAKKAYQINNRRTRSGLVQNPPSSTPYVPPTKNDWDTLFQPMSDEYFNPPSNVVSLVPAAVAPRHADPTGSPLSTSIDQDAPFNSTSSKIQETQSLVISKGVEEHIQLAPFDDDLFLDILTSEPSSQESSSIVKPVNPPFEHISKWTKNHLLENVIGNPSRHVSIRKQL
uniref:Integrase, catalytic region, zinc finger, CCHC-type, peptidase aspartic, catalytic n=1 Tax=Tanacetum cinerariifolium TaxID=118510 RepID=A0A6L2L5D2_TANCI|nr:integrase, catalytic region, zinc finger, CCHC-type, peptidase aspartic, catalytic [Tanacetum cinerariifolium]